MEYPKFILDEEGLARFKLNEEAEPKLVKMFLLAETPYGGEGRTFRRHIERNVTQEELDEINKVFEASTLTDQFTFDYSYQKFVYMPESSSTIGFHDADDKPIAGYLFPCVTASGFVTKEMLNFNPQ